MEFKTYDPEKDDYIYDSYEELLERPEDVEKYRSAIAEALEDAEEVVGMSSDVEIVFGLADPDRIEERWGEDAATNFHVHGFTFGSWFDDRDRDFIFLYANDVRDDWEAALKNMTVHERAHIDFYDKHSDEQLSERLEGSVYNSVLFEGHSTNTAAKLNEEKGYGWSPGFRKTGNSIDSEKLDEELQKDRAESEFFDHGGEQWTDAQGYPVSYEIFNWILENEGLKLQELPELSEEEAKDLIDEAVQNLYL